MPDDTTAIDPHSAHSFWAKVGTVAQQAGVEVIEKALWLYYAAQKPEVPVKAKAVIYGVLAYLILPLDVVPDALPVLGFGDDLAALVSAVATVAVHIDEAVKTQASGKLRDWFGPRKLSP